MASSSTTFHLKIQMFLWSSSSNDSFSRKSSISSFRSCFSQPMSLCLDRVSARKPLIPFSIPDFFLSFPMMITKIYFLFSDIFLFEIFIFYIYLCLRGIYLFYLFIRYIIIIFILTYMMIMIIFFILL